MRNSWISEYGVVAAGGAIGAVARWLTAQVIVVQPSGIPLATLAVNLVGCTMIGFAARLVGQGAMRSRREWWFAVTGILGGFTTFSSFAVETERLAAGGRILAAAAYTAITLLGGYAAVWLASGGQRPTPDDSAQLPQGQRPSDWQD